MLRNRVAASEELVATIDKCLATLPGLATLPQTAVEILRLAKDDNATAEDFHNVIAIDPALCVRVLKVVNSSYYGLSRKIDSIRQAIVLLGPNAVRNIAIASSMQKIFRIRQAEPGCDPQDLWVHSLTVATAAREIARLVDQELEETAFLAGLIHDVGMIAEMQIDRSRFTPVIRQLAAEEGITVSEAEAEVVEALHELFGARLCRQWKLPLHLELVAGYHHRPECLDETESRLPAITHLADILADQVDHECEQTSERLRAAQVTLERLGLQISDLEEVLERLPQAIEDMHRLFADS